MSHFSVCVIVPQSESGELLKVRQLEDRLQTILAPFDEQTEEPEYREFEDRTEEAKAGYEVDTVQVVRFPDGTICYYGNGMSRDYGIFGRLITTLKDKEWFMTYLTKWLWYNSDDGEDESDFTIEDVLYHYARRESAA